MPRQLRLLMPELFGRGDQFHPESPHCEATLGLPRTLSQTLAQRLWDAIHETCRSSGAREDYREGPRTRLLAMATARVNARRNWRRDSFSWQPCDVSCYVPRLVHCEHVGDVGLGLPLLYREMEDFHRLTMRV